MEIRAKSPVEVFLVMLAASAALFAQSSGPDKPQNDAIVLDAHQIVSLSIAATERSWQARDHYTYIERDEDRRLDSLGQVKSENVDVTRMTLVNGARFEQLMEHNGQHPTAKEQKKSDEDLDKLKHETPTEQTARLHQDQENRSFLRDILEAFDFHVIGEEVVGGRPAYVLQATPHAGYHAHGKFGKMFSKVEGKLWVDKQDFGWIKVDGEVTQLGGEVVLGEFESHSGGIVVALVGIINRQRQQLRSAVFCMQGIAQVGCERRDSTASRKVISYDGDSIGERRVRRYRCQNDGLLFQCERLNFNQPYGFYERLYFRQRHSIPCESMTCGRFTA
jgi:hypothetical protein